MKGSLKLLIPFVSKTVNGGNVVAVVILESNCSKVANCWLFDGGETSIVACVVEKSKLSVVGLLLLSLLLLFIMKLGSGKCCMFELKPVILELLS